MTDFDLHATAQRVAQQWLGDLEYSYVYEDESIPEPYWVDVYETIIDNAKAVIQ